MATIIPPGFAEVSLRIRHTLLARAAFTTFGISIVAGGGNPQDLAAQVDMACAPFLYAGFDTNVVVDRVRVTIGQDGGPPVIGDLPVNRPGGRGMNSTAPALALLVNKVTSLGGRRGRGRFFLPWYVSVANVSEAGTIAPAEVTSLQTRMAEWHGDFDDQGISPVILHRTGVSVPPAPTPIVGFQVDPLISNQVRRQPRMG